MSHIDITRTHSLETSEVKKLVKTVADDLITKYGGSYEVNDDVTNFKAPGVEGAFTILEGAIRIQAKLGLLMRPLKGVIEKQINDEIEVLVAKYDKPEKVEKGKPTKKTSSKIKTP